MKLIEMSMRGHHRIGGQKIEDLYVTCVGDGEQD